jgi:hypothetical protein
VLTQPLIVDDPDDTLVVLGPGEEKCGEIDLVRRIPALTRFRRREDVLVFWAYQQMLSDLPEGRVAFGGMFVLKQLR